MTSSYPHGFEGGVSIQNVPINVVASDQGYTVWVDSATGSDGIFGATAGFYSPANQQQGTFKKPFATIKGAVAYLATVSKQDGGDVIYVAAGHVEPIIAAGTLTIATPGITIVFLGEGAQRATINYTTIVSASVVVSAANVTLVNPRFTCNFDALTSPITVTGADFKLINGEWYDSAAKAATNCIVASNAAARLTIDGWKFFASTTGTQKATNIKMTDVASPVLRNIDITGDFSTAPINISAAATNVRYENVKLNNINATPKPGIDQHANTTGMAKNIDIRVASGTTYVSSVAKLNYDSNCLGYSGDGKGGDPIGTADNSSIEGQVLAIKAVTDLLPNAGALTTITDQVNKVDAATLAVSPTAGSLARFVASGGTALGTQLADSKSIVDAVGSNGTTLVYGSGSILGAKGTHFWLKKTVVSSTITFGAPVDITGVSTGELVIDQVILKTDSTGLAGGTNFQILTNNTKGAAVFFANTVAGLGASVTVDTGGVTNQKTVLTSGKKIQIQNTIADGTGAGTVDIYIKCIRVDDGATIAVV